ncbi:NAD(P)-dependent oxidoreductase [Geothrix oryzae]|uniref:NAD(P)-dependent oxidoreductase n=1 Tax=Geothrix oryzae TaxID=2927975 RepID=A0ABN6V0W0_9BACT|nr:NAD-dependent epimerase/dehydratase family protein [Geothrix oryzae]BDU70165.1 NAD(P)-dependent oxidoreductase [Geothrix oryzae]
MENRQPASTGTCLIAGCGYTGVRLARRLVARGPVLALVRSPTSAAALTAELAYADLQAQALARALDLDAPGAFEVPRDLESVLYLAPPPGHGEGDPRFQRFLAGLGGARPKVLVYLSTTGVYGDAQGRAVDEATPPVPGDAAGRRRLAAEQAAFAWGAERGVRSVALRVAGIYGPGRLPLERLRSGEPVLRPEDSGPGNRIQVEDLVAACLAALDRPVAGPVNVTDGDPRSIGAFLELVARLAGLPAPRRVTLEEARRELSPGMLAFLLASRRVLNRRLVENLGVTLRYADPEAGVRESLRQMGLISTAAR